MCCSDLCESNQLRDVIEMYYSCLVVHLYTEFSRGSIQIHYNPMARVPNWNLMLITIQLQIIRFLKGVLHTVCFSVRGAYRS